jgi:hypothetical protein
MKKTVTTLGFVLAFYLGYCQNIVLLNTDTADISNAIVNINMAPSTTNTTEVLIRNSGSVADTLKVTRSVQVADPNDLTQFCFGGLCYSYTTNVSSLTLIVPPGETKGFFDNGFHAAYSASSSTITRKVHYKFYNIHNALDSAGVSFHYLFTTGIDDMSIENNTLSNAYPNPTNSTVSFKYNLNNTSEKGKIVFYDMLGKSVKEVMLNDRQGSIKINITDLNPGIYFYTYMVDDKTISSKKLIITD